MSEERPNLKIQSRLPVRTIGIETQRERKNFSDLPPQNYIHTWFARRPTPASRLAVLTSVLPDTIDDNQLLKQMGINPNNLSSSNSITDHVREKHRTEDQRSGRVYEHYGYRKIYKKLPSETQIEDLHQVMKETWDGELPTVLDATAGGGSIPLESSRYGLPTIANELNSVAAVILKAVLEHHRINGDLSDDIQTWGDEINERAQNELKEYFPSEQRETPTEYIWANTVTCPDCGLEIPLSPNWWLINNSGKSGVAARPSVSKDGNKVEFNIVNIPDDIEKDEFNPSNSTVSYGKAECLRCNVTVEKEELQRQAQEEGLGQQLYAIHFEHNSKSSQKNGFRAPTAQDIEAAEKAREKVQSDPELATLLSTQIPDGKETDRTNRYGIDEWRDMFSLRQLLTHYTYWQKFEEVKTEIREEYDQDSAEVILTFLTFAADKGLNYNSRSSGWNPHFESIQNTFDRHDFAFMWSYAESNFWAPGSGYDWCLDSIVEVYNELVDLAGYEYSDVTVLQGDASDLPLDDKGIEVIVLDPPYYDNIMYAELSDFFYVWMKKYLDDVFPDFFSSDLTEKGDEAVANPSKFDDIAGDESSSRELAKNEYESKMTDIFGELHRVLDEEGIFSLMFTHKKTEAWDTLTSALIEAGFVVTSSHPISTEFPYSFHQAGKNSAESTILLASEKRSKEDNTATLWSEIQRDTRQVARDHAEMLDQGEVDFAKVDIILASFGPTLEVFTRQYPVVDDEGNEVTPQTALNEARAAVRDYFIDKYLNSGVRDVDPKTEWYILAWLIFEVQRFPYDEGRRLAIGMGEELDNLKRTHRMWRKKSGDVLLRPHQDRVQDVNKDPDNRSGRKPVNPDSLSFATALDKVHASMHVYEAKGATEAWNWMNDRNCGSDPSFKATLEALLRVLPHEHDDWKLARDIAAGETGELLDLDLDADIFEEDDDDEDRQGSLNDF